MRRKRNYKRDHKPDLEYNSIVAGRFINALMQDGKKSTARKILYDAFSEIKEKTKKDPLKVFEEALEKVMPVVEVATRRVGGANYQIPREVRPARKFMLATRWIIAAAKSKKGKDMSSRLADEIIAAANGEGEAIKKKENVKRMAEANRAFAHFSW